MNEKIKLGILGEDIACQYLIENKYKIIERNYRKPWGEIDIIAKSPDKVLVFVEVKAIRQYGNSEYDNQFGNRQCGNEKSGNVECGNLKNEKYGNDFLPHSLLPHSKFKRILSFFHNTAIKNNSATNNTATDNAATDNAATDNAATDNAATDNAAIRNTAMDNAAILKNNSAIWKLPNCRIQHCRISSTGFDDCRITPEMQMTKAKIKKIRRTASLYTGSHPELIDDKKGWRIDLFALTIAEKDCLIYYYNNI